MKLELAAAMDEGRSPKSEVRRAKAGGRDKSEIRNPIPHLVASFRTALSAAFQPRAFRRSDSFRTSDFGLRTSRILRISGFGFRVLDFGFLPLLILLLSIPAASAKPPPPPPTNTLVWPAPPDAPRIAYVQSLTRPTDGGAKVSVFKRLTNWVTGDAAGNEPFIKPFGIALDEKGNLCLTDTAYRTVGYLDRAKNKWRRWDHLGPVRFLSPVAVARRAGIFYVADSARPAVIAFRDDGKLLFQITNRLARPSGLTITGDRLCVADSERHCIWQYDLRGQPIGQFGERGAGPGQFNFPTHLGTDAAGRLYVTDSMNSRVQVFDAAGHFQSQLGQLGDSPGHFSRPKGVAVDSFGHIYVLDALFDNIQIFDREGRFLMSLGASGGGPGEFWLPNGIAISPGNDIYVADAYNRRVQVFKFIGQP